MVVRSLHDIVTYRLDLNIVAISQTNLLALSDMIMCTCDDLLIHQAASIKQQMHLLAKRSALI
jgi:hypothetical protein